MKHQMWSVLLAAAAALSAAAPAAQVKSDVRSVDFYTRNGMAALTPSWNSIKQQVSAHDRQIADQIDVSVRATEGVNGISSRPGGQRTIEITAGMLEVIDWLATAHGVEAMTGELKCEAAYVKYVGDGVTENTERHNESEGVPLQLVTSPYQFYSSHRSICTNVSPDQVNGSRNGSLTRTLTMNESIKYVLGHELGHHINNDFTRIGWCEQQKRETRADAYSFKLLSHSGESPMNAFLILSIFATVENYSANDQGRTHPAALKRQVKMVDATLAQLDDDTELRDSLKASGKLAAFESYLTQLKDAAEEEIEKDDSGCEE
jgi:hypothetical protein